MKRRWDWLADLTMRHGFTRGAELGVKEGRMTQFLLQYNPMLELIAVDLWAERPEAAERKGGETYEDWDFGKIRSEFNQRVVDFVDRLTVCNMSTDEAAGQVSDALDFVFIDAEHSYEGVSRDIERWRPLVRSGGLIAGHDFNHKWPMVQKAVTDHFHPMDVFLGPDSCWGVMV